MSKHSMSRYCTSMQCDYCESRACACICHDTRSAAEKEADRQAYEQEREAQIAKAQQAEASGAAAFFAELDTPLTEEDRRRGGLPSAEIGRERGAGR